MGGISPEDDSYGRRVGTAVAGGGMNLRDRMK
jgi:hypothetical protein